MFGVLMYEYVDGESPLVGRRVFASEVDAERFAWAVVGSEVRSESGGVALVSLACLWECDESGVFVRPMGNEFEG